MRPVCGNARINSLSSVWMCERVRLTLFLQVFLVNFIFICFVTSFVFLRYLLSVAVDWKDHVLGHGYLFRTWRNLQDTFSFVWQVKFLISEAAASLIIRELCLVKLHVWRKKGKCFNVDSTSKVHVWNLGSLSFRVSSYETEQYFGNKNVPIPEVMTNVIVPACSVQSCLK